MRRKVRNVEKVEKLYRTATVQKIVPTHFTKSDHACAMLWVTGAKPARSCTARRKMRP